MYLFNYMIYCLIRNRALQVGIRAMLVLSGPKPGELPVVFEWLSYLRYLLCCSVGCFSRCMRHVRKYCRYLFWRSDLLGGSELSGGVAAYSWCCRGIFWMEKLGLLWLWFLLSMRSFRGFVLKSMWKMLWFLSV